MSAVAWVLWLTGMVALLAFLVMRLTGIDEHRLRAIQGASLGRAPVIAAVPALVLDVLQRLGMVDIADMPPSGLLALAVVIFVLVTTPGLGPVSRAHATGAELTLVTINLERDAPAARTIADQLLGFDADLLLIQEYTAATATACATAGLHDSYPHRIEDPRENFFGSALLSRSPLRSSDSVVVGERPMVWTVMVVGCVNVAVANVHIQAPVERRDIGPWRGAFADLSQLVGDVEGPAILAGDWNAVLTHAPLRQLLRRHRLVDAHRARARWRWPRTWPTDRGPIPPLLCLDHVLVTPDIEVVTVSEKQVEGTDHKAVVARLRLPQPVLCRSFAG